jgi:ABC-2 type transport system ATP-binding protein
MAETLPSIIVCERVACWYGNVPALTEVTMQVPNGITGLLGPNGAGKSTLLRILTGQIRPSSGSARVLGKDPLTDSTLFDHLGFCSEDDALFEGLSARTVVRLLARLSGIAESEVKERADDALARVGMLAVADREASKGSKGMRQRVRIAAALVHAPRLILLDEPMTGLDPVGRRDILALLENLAADGVHVLFSSHILHEVASVATHIVVLNRGMVLAEGALSAIRAELADYAFTLCVRCDDPRRLASHLLSAGYVTGLRFEGDDLLHISSASSLRLIESLPAAVLESGVAVNEMQAPGEAVEAVFQRLIG